MLLLIVPVLLSVTWPTPETWLGQAQRRRREDLLRQERQEERVQQEQQQERKQEELRTEDVVRDERDEKELDETLARERLVDEQLGEARRSGAPPPYLPERLGDESHRGPPGDGGRGGEKDARGAATPAPTPARARDSPAVTPTLPLWGEQDTAPVATPAKEGEIEAAYELGR